MGPTTFLSRQRKASAPPFWVVRWTSNSASIEPYIPCKRPISSSWSSCTTAQPHAPHLPAFHDKEPSVATWPLKPSAGMPQLLCSRDSHFVMQNKAFIPLAFTERVRADTSLPLPHFPRRSPFLLPCPEGPERFHAILHVASLTLTFVRPACVEVSFIAKLFGPLSPRILPQESWSWFGLGLFIFMLCCPLLPIDCSDLLQEQFLHIFWSNISHFDVSVAFENQCVPMRPLDTQITGLAHHCSCRSSHLSPHLDFLSLPHPRYFVHDAFFQSKLLLPSTEWPR